MKEGTESRTVGVVLMGAIVVVLVIFLVITWVEGDVTNHLGDRQPEPSPAESSAPAMVGHVARWGTLPGAGVGMGRPGVGYEES